MFQMSRPVYLFCRSIKTFTLINRLDSVKNYYAIANLKKYDSRQFIVRSTSTTTTDLSSEKKLFTPGPLGTSASIKRIMLRDVGSRDIEFINCVANIRQKLLDIAEVNKEQYTTIPVQGSGTYSVEAVLQSTVPQVDGKVLILENGAYGKRIAKICDVLNISKQVLTFDEGQPVDVGKVEETLRKEPTFTHVTIVHCETSCGVFNPVTEVGKVVKKFIKNGSYFVDAMSSFGAVPLDFQAGNIDYMVSSANKCLEGVPGFSYVIARTEKLLQCKGYSRCFSLDLIDQYNNLENSGQFRFTPPTHTMLAFQQAIAEFEQEGGVKGRAARYMKNRSILKEGMQKLGFTELLTQPDQPSYIITSFHYPNNPNFDFKTFYHKLNERDFVIYPGKVIHKNCFRIGTIGQIFPEDIEKLLLAIEEVCKEMNISLPIES